MLVESPGTIHWLVLNAAWHRTNELTDPAACAVLCNDPRLKVVGEGNGLVRIVVARHVALAALDTYFLIDNGSVALAILLGSNMLIPYL